MQITYRPPKAEDLESATRIVQDAYNDVRVQHGLPPSIVLGPPLLQTFPLSLRWASCGGKGGGMLGAPGEMDGRRDGAREAGLGLGRVRAPVRRARAALELTTSSQLRANCPMAHRSLPIPIRP